VTDSNGVDTYAEVKNAGKFKIVPRTDGVSTTDLVGRMLLALSTKDAPDVEDKGTGFFEVMSQGANPLTDEKIQVSKFNADKGVLETVINGRKPKETEKIGYINGTWDLFHYGHVSILKKAKELCDYLVVGVFPSDVVKEKKGHEWPIMSMKERGLTVLACKYVDHVILGVPWDISPQIVKTLRDMNAPKVVVFVGESTDPAYHTDDKNDGLQLAREQGLLHVIDSGESIHATTIIQRIIQNRSQYLERQMEKARKAQAGFS